MAQKREEGPPKHPCHIIMLVCLAQVICWNHSHSQQIHTDTGVLRKYPVAKTAQITCHGICMRKKVLIYSAKWLSGYRCLLECIVNRTEGCQKVSGGSLQEVLTATCCWNWSKHLPVQSLLWFQCATLWFFLLPAAFSGLFPSSRVN